jgi:hypothetical protein
MGGGNADPTLVSGLFGIIFLAIPAIVAFAFSYLLALRPVVVGIMTILTPVAFAAYIFPTGQNLFRKWLTILTIALFYTPVAHLVLYFLNLMFPVNSTGNGFLVLLAILFKTAVFVFLIRLPFTIETDIQKITLALSRTSFGAGLGLGKATDKEVKVKQENKNPVSDRILESKGAKSIIAPVNGSYRRDIITPKASNDNRRSINQIFNRNNRESLISNLNQVSDKAHNNNLLRNTGLLVNSVADLSPQALRKIAYSSNFKIAQDSALVGELKQKNGQLLDDEGAMTRADAGRKVIRAAELVDQGKIGNPEAVKMLSQKQMLDVLPLDILKKALAEGIINEEDIRNNFKGNPSEVTEKIARFNRGRALNSSEIMEATKRDYADSKTGYTDLKSAMQLSLTERPEQAKTNIVRAVEATRNQPDFDKNGMYYLARLNEAKTQSKEKLANGLKQAGTPGQTAIALAQNPNLNIQQLSAYVPKTAPAQAIQMIRESVAERNTTQGMIDQVASSLKEDKVVMGKAIAEKVSESLNKGTVKSFDDVKRQVVDSLKGLSKNSNPQEVKSAATNLNSFTPVAQVQTAQGSTPADVQKIKEKGEAVLSTIDEMKMAQVDEKTLSQNPKQAVEKYSTHVQKTVNEAANGQAKVENALPNPGAAQINSQTPSAEEKLPDNPSQVADTMNKVLSSDAKDGTTFEQKLTDISKNQPADAKSNQAKPQAGPVNG